MAHARAVPCFFEPNQNPQATTVARCLTPPDAPDGRALPTLFLIGDSHAGALHPAVSGALAGRMRLAFLGRASTGIFPFGTVSSGFDDLQRGAQPTWLQAVMSALRANVRRGDVVAIMNNYGFQNFAWLRQTMLNGVLRPAGASLLLFGDSPRLNHPAVVCHNNHMLCQNHLYHAIQPRSGTLRTPTLSSLRWQKNPVA